MTTGKRTKRTKLDFWFPISRSAIGQASCLICARRRQMTFPFCAFTKPLPILKQFQLGVVTIRIFLEIFERHSIKTSIFFKFQSTSILAILSNGRQETVSIPKYSAVLKNKTGPLFLEWHLMGKKL